MHEFNLFDVNQTANRMKKRISPRNYIGRAKGVHVVVLNESRCFSYCDQVMENDVKLDALLVVRQ